MKPIELGAEQTRFADLVWANEPIRSAVLIKLCQTELHWKKSTAYTVLRKLCEKGLFENRDGMILSRIGRDEFYSEKSRMILAQSFSGSLPAFVAAFVSKNTLTHEEAEQIQKIIDTFKGGTIS